MISVVTCDIVGSAKYPGSVRAQMQEHLLKSWESVKAKFADKLDSDLSLRVTAGDEFQFVCKDVGTALDCVTLLRIKCRTLAIKPSFTFRASLGIGERNVSGDSNPYSQDGPAFHLARAGMEELKKGTRLTTVRLQNSRGSEAIDSIFPVTDVIYEQWTIAQAKVMELAFGGIIGDEIADLLKIRKQAVSKHLQRSHWFEYSLALLGIVLLLDRHLTYANTSSEKG
jgi:transcriptional regulator